MSIAAQFKLRSSKREKNTFCLSCNAEMHSAHIGICAECIDDDCGKFADLFEEDDNIEEYKYETFYPREE